MIAGQVDSGSRYQSRQPGDEVLRCEHNVGGAILQRLFEFIDDLSVRVGRQSLATHGRPGDLSTKVLKPVALVRLAGDCRVQGKTVALNVNGFVTVPVRMNQGSSV